MIEQTKILVLGASGVIGQHMMLCKPKDVQARYYRRHLQQQNGNYLFYAADWNTPGSLTAVLESFDPDIVINMAGNGNVDEVEKASEKFAGIHFIVPDAICRWCTVQNRRYVHVSSQAVFPGTTPPYRKFAGPGEPVNRYGVQKKAAEQLVTESKCDWVIVRPTFILGTNVIPAQSSRQTAVERMLLGQEKQVHDRYFSTLGAWDAGVYLWEIALNAQSRSTINLGGGKTTRWDIAQELGMDVESVPHSRFVAAGMAERPIDTTYADQEPVVYKLTPQKDVLETYKNHFLAMHEMGANAMAQRAKEIALFTGRQYLDVVMELGKGFGHFHGRVREDFLAHPHSTPEELLKWYQWTEAYIWELTMYHIDPGFNYLGMCRGIGERLRGNHGGINDPVLCLGDGIGDLTLTLRREYSINAVYNDLVGSRTAAFARFRFWMYDEEVVPLDQCTDWEPEFGCSTGNSVGKYAAVIALDVLEHVPNVEAWVKRIWKVLQPGGLFMAQNAFNMGSGEQGSIPCHLSKNDHWEKDWDPMLTGIGFAQESSNWYRKPV